jgi:hypothetical protein
MGTTVRVVFQPLDSRRDRIFGAGKVDDSVMSFMTTTTVPDRNTTGVIPSVGGTFVLGQRWDRPTFVEPGRYHPDHPATTG